MKTGLLFSGQGAQSVGMAKSLFDKYDFVRDIFALANDTLGFDLQKCCFEGPDELLTQTKVCQPALYVHGYCAYKALEKENLLGELVTASGLSLGELTAHAIAGTYDFQTGLKIVAKRGLLMQEACDKTKGAMASIIGGDLSKIEEICNDTQIDISNLNCPGQTVISGEAQNVAKAIEIAKESGQFKMVIPLKVAGAYHSRLMEPARQEFAEFLNEFEFNTPKLAVFTNVTGEQISDPKEIKEALIKQVVSCVMWQKCFENSAKLGVDQFFECGPGGVLTTMAKRTDKTQLVKSINTSDDISSFVS